MSGKMDDPMELFAEFEDVNLSLASGNATKAPFSLRQRIVASTKDPSTPPTSPQKAYRTQCRELSALLPMIDNQDCWRDVIADGMDVRGVLLHLAVVDGFAYNCIAGTETNSAIDIASATENAIFKYKDEPSEVIAAVWQEQTDALAMLADEISDEDAPVTYLGNTLTIGQVLTDRSFETWLHAQDIRNTLGLSIELPEEGPLGLMTDLGARLLPLVLENNSKSRTTARLVIPGRSGGTWLVPFDSTSQPSEPSVTVTIDAMSFCLLIADRVDMDSVTCEIAGDKELANQLLSGASRLARL